MIIENIFPSLLTTIKVDPTEYDKVGIVDRFIENYHRQPHRQNWGHSANLHHYYKDWDNPQLPKPDLSSLIKIYAVIFENFINQLGIDLNFEWYFSIENISVHKEPYHFMTGHDHFEHGSYYTAVHYLQTDINASAIELENPLACMLYLSEQYKNTNKKIFNDNKIAFSTYYKHWSIKPEEDSMIIFPSYIKHKVDPPGTTLSKYRICVAINLYFKTNDID